MTGVAVSSLKDAQDDWKAWERLGDPVEHIALRDWADILVVAPLSAHTLAKLSQGLCDDTLSCVFRAWDFGHSTTRTASSVNHAGGGGGKPVVLAPAMNTAMWEHPLTRQQLDRICSFWKESNESSSGGVTIVPPQSKLLACGDTGVGALADLDAIVQSVRDIILQQQQQRNQRYLDGTDSVPRIP